MSKLLKKTYLSNCKTGEHILKIIPDSKSQKEFKGIALWKCQLCGKVIEST